MRGAKEHSPFRKSEAGWQYHPLSGPVRRRGWEEGEALPLAPSGHSQLDGRWLEAGRFITGGDVDAHLQWAGIALGAAHLCLDRHLSHIDLECAERLVLVHLAGRIFHRDALRLLLG